MILVALVIAALTSPVEVGPDNAGHWGGNVASKHERQFEQSEKK